MVNIDLPPIRIGKITSEGPSTTEMIMGFVYTAIWIFSIFLSFRCAGTFDLFHFLAACCCPLCYLPYGIFCAFFSNSYY